MDTYFVSFTQQFWVEETHGAIGTDLGGAKTKKDHMAALRLAKKLDTTVASSWSASHEPRNALAIFLGGFAAAHEINGGLVPLKAIVRIAKDLLRCALSRRCRGRCCTYMLQ